MGSLFSSDMPDRPNYAQEMTDMVKAYGSLMPYIYGVESQYAPQFNALYAQEQAKAMQAYQQAYQQAQLQGLQLAPQLAKAQLAYEAEYGPQFVAQQMARLREADPAYYAVRDQLGQQVADDLALGNQLSQAQSRNVEQNVRAAQAARGNMTGNALSGQEVLGKFLAGEGLKTQRQNAAANFLSGGSVSPNTTSTGAAQNLLAASAGQQTQTQSYFPNAAQAMAQLGVNTAQNDYGAQVNWASQQVSPFAAITGTIFGGLGTAANMGWQPFK